MGTSRTSPGTVALTLVLIGALSLGAARVSDGSEHPRASGPAAVPVLESAIAPRGSIVRWGGVIDRVDVQASDVVVQVVGYPLDGLGQPVLAAPSAGRFLVIAADRAYAHAYAVGRLITVTGLLSAEVDADSPYGPLRLPVVRSRFHQIFPRTSAPVAYLPREVDDRYDSRPHRYDGAPYRSDAGLLLLGTLAIAGAVLAADHSYVSIGLGYGHGYRHRGHGYGYRRGHRHHARHGYGHRFRGRYGAHGSYRFK